MNRNQSSSQISSSSSQSTTSHPPTQSHSQSTLSAATPTRPCFLCLAMKVEHPNEATPGMRTCEACRGETPPPLEAGSSYRIPGQINQQELTSSHVRNPGTAKNKAAQALLTGGKRSKSSSHPQAQQPLVGVTPPSKRIGTKRKPTEKVLCACGCGKPFYRIIGNKRKYYSDPCRKSHFRGAKKGKHPPITPEIAEELKVAYRDKVGLGKPVIKELSEKHNIPVWKIVRWASDVGLSPMRHTESAWTDAELKFVQDNARWTSTVISKKMREAGVGRRTPNSISMKIFKMGGKTQFEKGWSATKLSKFFGVDDHTINAWIQKGLLEAERKGTRKGDGCCGDTWYIYPENVKRFVRNNVHLVDLRKVEKLWFVRLLCGELECKERKEPCSP